MIGHTRGPWEVDSSRADDENELHVFTLFDMGGCALPYVIARIKFDGMQKDARVEANARLIAAAPDLLAALYATAAQLLACNFALGPNKDIENAILCAESAMAKAIGSAA